jgi:flagellin
MSTGVTLTAAMRANLYSLQQTSQLMGTIQNRLSTGKKVNSALDNPNNYFSAQSLSNRASDLSNLLDGMGQAIQAITQASNGITSAQKLVDSMKAVANSAIQASSSGAASATQAVVANGPVDTTSTLATSTTAANGDGTHLLTNMTNATTGATLGIRVGDTMTIAVTGASTFTFTVGQTSTMKDLQSFIDGVTGTPGNAVITAGKLTITNGNAADITIAGNLKTSLGLAAAGGVIVAAATGVPTVTIGTGPTAVQAADSVHRLTGLTDANGNSLNIKNGDTLTYQLGTGQTLSFTVGGAKANTLAGYSSGGSSVADLENWLSAQVTDKAGVASNIVAAMNASGQLTITSDDTTRAVNLGGTLATTLGLAPTVASASSATGTTKAYVAPQSAVPVATGSTLLRDLSQANGELVVNGAHSGAVNAATTGGTGTGNVVTVTTTTGVTNITISDGMTVQNLLDKMNTIDPHLSFSLDTSGHVKVDNETAGAVTINGTGGAGLFNADPSTPTSYAVNGAGAAQSTGVTLYAGFSPAAGSSGTAGAVDAASATQFDTLRTQLDQLINNSSYQGINLISGTGNSPLTVTFDEKATNAASLVIKAVDLTSTGLGIKAAGGTADGAWTKTDDVKTALADLTTAANTLRTQSAVLGTNLSTVQTRQDFTNNMIATLKAGSDSLTLADMNEESANMLALQTRSQLGTQALSLANQANQSVMRLFG